jgi:hypothetical protein
MRGFVIKPDTNVYCTQILSNTSVCWRAGKFSLNVLVFYTFCLFIMIEKKYT